jgi:hypothetical protein
MCPTRQWSEVAYMLIERRGQETEKESHKRAFRVFELGVEDPNYSTTTRGCHVARARQTPRRIEQKI